MFQNYIIDNFILIFQTVSRIGFSNTNNTLVHLCNELFGAIMPNVKSWSNVPKFVCLTNYVARVLAI